MLALSLKQKVILCAFWYVVVILFSSCKKNVPDYNKPAQNFKDVFELFWNQVNVNYVYWGIDTTQWDKVYSKYKPVFENLSLNDLNDVKKSVQIFREISGSLIDGHFYIDFTRAGISDSSVYPAYDRKKQNVGFHNPYPYYVVVKNYLDAGFVEGIDNVSDPLDQSLYALSGTIDNRLLYFYCSSFKLSHSYNSLQQNNAKPVLDYFFGKVKDLPPEIKGIVIDMRNNPGGDLSDLNFFAGNFIDQPLHFGYTSHKSGNGRLDYSPWIKSIVNPREGAKKVRVPMVILIDNFSASLSELLTIAIRSLPNCIIVGEHSWGATGPLTSFDVYNDGQFEIPGFMSVKESSAMFKDIANQTHESTGIVPDHFVPFERDALNRGQDLQLEMAISKLP